MDCAHLVLALGFPGLVESGSQGCARGQIETMENGVDMVLDRGKRDDEFCCNLAVGFALCDQYCDLLLSRSQRSEELIVGSVI